MKLVHAPCSTDNSTPSHLRAILHVLGCYRWVPPWETVHVWRQLSLSVRIALAYFVFGLLWIIGSDTLVETLAVNQTQQSWLQTYKGAGFIAVSALLIGWLVYNESHRRARIRRLLDEVVGLAPDPVLIRQYEDDMIVEANERFVQEVGISEEELNETSLDDLELDLAERRREDLRHQLATEGEVLNYQQTLEGRSGRSVELLISSRRIEFGADEYVCTVAKDITDLERAYDETIQGWARALELRDDETFAHTLRVTRATVALAEHLGVPDDELIHIRRGALLHDIGKIGVPDAILLKDGDLTDEEWRVVRKHPLFAKELLSPISYLQPAIPIPHRHHEKWDGSGYPDGLAGEEIPLAARIFAVVDVWDALRSDRPYREAWEAERVLEVLDSDKGSHFQPEIVEAFFDLGDDRRQALRDVETVSILEKTADEA